MHKFNKDASTKIQNMNRSASELLIEHIYNEIRIQKLIRLLEERCIVKKISAYLHLFWRAHQVNKEVCQYKVLIVWLQTSTLYFKMGAEKEKYKNFLVIIRLLYDQLCSMVLNVGALKKKHIHKMSVA